MRDAVVTGKAVEQLPAQSSACCGLNQTSAKPGQGVIAEEPIGWIHFPRHQTPLFRLAQFGTR